jgi:hypothetical protein
MLSDNEKDKAISYTVEEIETNNENQFNIEELLAEIENSDLDDDLVIPQIINYHENFTVKELILICEYYGFAKDIKNNKLNKEEIIDALVAFELNPNNSYIVFKRQNMWFNINELKKDKFMKKFILW